MRLTARAAVPALVLVPLLLSGCGPSVPVAVGVKNVPLDILVGRDTAQKHTQPAEAPPMLSIPALPPLLTVGGDSSPVQYLHWTPPPLADSLPPICPTVDPLKASLAPADPTIATTATKGLWLYNQGGQAGWSTTPGTVPPQELRGIYAASGGAGAYSFGQFGGILGLPATSSAVFNANDGSSGPSTPLVSTSAQLGLHQLVVIAPGAIFLYQPSQPLELLAMPAEKNITYQPDPNNPALPTLTGSWNATAADPLDGTAATISATNTGIVRDNVCGTPLDAWRVQATLRLVGTLAYQGSTLMPATTNLTITGTYDVATGLGGMIVGESVSCSGTVAGQPYTCNGYQASLASAKPLQGHEVIVQ